MNSASIVGRLTKDPELRKSSSGLSVCSFTVAVDRPVKKNDQNGEQQTADFIQCVAWRGSADYLCNYGQKGSRVGVDGRIQTRNYTNQQGQKVYVTEILANSVEVYGQNSKQQSNDYPHNGTSVSRDDISRDIANDPSDPFNTQANAEPVMPSAKTYEQQTADGMQWGYQSGQSNAPADVSDDDLPF